MQKIRKKELYAKTAKKKKKKKNCRQTYRQKDGHDIVKGYNFQLSRGPKSQSEKSIFFRKSKSQPKNPVNINWECLLIYSYRMRLKNDA